MNGLVEHLINAESENCSELEFEVLNESVDIENMDFDFEKDFSNEAEPGDIGNATGNADDIDVDGIDEGNDNWEEHSSDPTDDLEGFEDLDESEDLNESCSKTMQQYQGWEDEDVEEAALFEECLKEGELWDATKNFGKAIKNKLTGKKPSNKKKKPVKK